MDDSTTACASALLRQTLSPLASLLEDASVTEIMVNGPDEVWAQSAGVSRRIEDGLGASALRTVLMLLSRLAGREPGVDSGDAWVETRFDGLRVAACAPPLAPEGPVLCLRRHPARRWSLADLIAGVPGQAPALDLLVRAVRAGEAILVAGATDAGKTTLLNALGSEIPPRERVITLEDTPELVLALPNRVSLATAGAPGTSMRDLLRLALRLRPDRILVGEVRGAEAFDLIQAALTGHRGTMATVHAGDPYAALARVESLALGAGVAWPPAALREAIGRAFQLLVVLDAPGGRRGVREVVRMNGWDEASGYRLQTLASTAGQVPGAADASHPAEGIGCARACAARSVRRGSRAYAPGGPQDVLPPGANARGLLPGPAPAGGCPSSGGMAPIAAACAYDHVAR